MNISFLGKILMVAAGTAFLFPAVAMAQTISSPYVTKGKASIENKGNYHWNDDGGQDGWKHALELKYGLTDWMSVSVESKIKNYESENTEYDATELEAKFELTDGVEDTFVDAGLKLVYEISGTGGADTVETSLLFAKRYTQWQHGLELIVGKEVGDDAAHGVNLGLEAGSYYKFDGFKLGGEYYGDFGSTDDNDSYSEQSHKVGPVVGFDIPVGGYEIETKLGYLHGISNGADDSTLKYQFEVAF